MVGREMGGSYVSLYSCAPAADQRIHCGPRGRSLDVVGLRCSGKTFKNKIEFYTIFKLDLKTDF